MKRVGRFGKGCRVEDCGKFPARGPVLALLVESTSGNWQVAMVSSVQRSPRAGYIIIKE
jgi:hypothetical protein